MIGQMLIEAWRAMGANRLRTFLTMLGMVIGVGAVVLMLAIGQGAQYSVEQSIASMGSNLFIILSGSSTSGGLRMGSGAVPTLTTADAQAIAELPELAAVAPAVPGIAQVVYGSNNWSTSVYGTTPAYLTVRNWTIARGAAFTDSDVRSATRVALLGQTVVENLFGDEDPLNKTIRINQSPYRVIGVLAVRGQSMDGRDLDDAILIPVTTLQRKLLGTQFKDTVRFITAEAASADLMPAAEKEMTALLRQRHHIQEGKDDDFTIRNLTALANAAAQATKVMSVMLGAIASISLLVGGIGIMNIMLVSVTERTREIGIRMAIGARQRDILMQFLLEAVIISIAGCTVGVLLGVAGAVAVNRFAQITVVVTGVSILMAFMVAAGVGMFFGFYPARKAARLKPIDAL
ncbi:MAG TPA: ABC transporter permease, partial [Burkholderiales bacterium]|nr:ABC transporter permease [Burkholderiales bacterium]